MKRTFCDSTCSDTKKVSKLPGSKFCGSSLKYLELERGKKYDDLFVDWMKGKL